MYVRWSVLSYHKCVKYLLCVYISFILVRYVMSAFSLYSLYICMILDSFVMLSQMVYQLSSSSPSICVSVCVWTTNCKLLLILRLRSHSIQPKVLTFHFIWKMEPGQRIRKDGVGESACVHDHSRHSWWRCLL